MNQPQLPERPPAQLLCELFVAPAMLAPQGCGGVPAVVQGEIIKRKQWLNRELFLADWALVPGKTGLTVAQPAPRMGGRHAAWQAQWRPGPAWRRLPRAIVLLALLQARLARHPGWREA